MRSLVVLVSIAACDAGERPAPPPKPAPIEEPAVDLAYLPGDVDGLMHFDVVALRGAKLWSQHGTTLSRIALPTFGDCGYDAMKTLTTIDVGFTAAGTTYTVFRGLERDEAMRCFKTAKPETVSFDGEVVKLTHPGRRPHLVTFIDARTMVMLGADQPSKDALAIAVKGGAPLAKNPGFVAAVRRVARGDAAIWLVSRPDSKQYGEAFGASGANITRMHATVHATDRLDVQAVIVTDTADAATALAKSLESQRESLKTFFDRLDARARDKTVTYDIGMSDAQLTSMVGMMRSMLGA